MEWRSEHNKIGFKLGWKNKRKEKWEETENGRERGREREEGEKREKEEKVEGEQKWESEDLVSLEVRNGEGAGK